MAGVVEWRAVGTGQLESDPGVYSFSCPLPEEVRALEADLNRNGVLRPLLCSATGQGGWRVLSGHRRLQWALAAGLAGIPVAVLEPCGLPWLWDLLLADALDHRPLNPVEKGLYLRRRMGCSGESMADLEAAVLPLLEMPPRAAAADDVLWVSSLPPEVREGFADGTRPLHAARLLRGAAREDALAILGATAGLVGGINKFTEVVRLLLECSWRDGLPVRGWLGREGLDRVWQSLDEFRLEARRLRYPRLSRQEDTFSRVIDRAGLPPGGGIHAPRGFEGRRYQCRLSFSSLEELRRELKETLQCVDEGRLAGLEEFLE